MKNDNENETIGTPPTSWKSIETVPKNRAILMRNSEYAAVLSVAWDGVMAAFEPMLFAPSEEFYAFIETADSWMDIPE